MQDLHRPARRQDVYVIGQVIDGRPGLRRIALSARPVDGDAPLRQSLELFDQSERTMRAGRLRVQQIARQQEEIRLFRQRRLEDPHRRTVRRLQQQLPQVFRDLGNPGDRPVKMEIGRVNEAEWPMWHRASLPAGITGLASSGLLLMIGKSMSVAFRSAKVGGLRRNNPG